ncbi:hypothetical protein [Legionella sp. W05-934-2]|jgi:hypothetical protein
MEILDENNEQESIITYKTLDKDYGRTKFAGPGYGEFDLEQYKELEELLK